MLKGIGAVPGYGIGTAVLIKDIKLDYGNVKFTNAENEKKRLKSAVDKFDFETKELSVAVRLSAGEKQAEILEGHLAMLKDPFMLSQMNEKIDGEFTAEKAVDTVCRSFADIFSSSDDELTRQRASDIHDIKDSLLRILLKADVVDITSVPENTVLVARDFTPSMTSRIKKENISAIVTETGGITSHSAIIARAMGIPAVLSVADAMKNICNGDTVIADGFSGEVLVSPTDVLISEYKDRQAKYDSDKEELKKYIRVKAVTKDGVPKSVYGNISKPEEAESVFRNGGEGIGLFRTEFLFMDRNSAPDEEEQFEVYASVAKVMGGKEIIIRTLDIGGDKAIDYLSIEKEDNPFLGHRAIRYCLDNRELFKTQLKAILRASAYGNIKIMLPLITSLDEVKEAKQIIFECKTDLKNNGQNYSDVPVGVMIETPSAVLISAQLAEEADFFSIGTNDLTGYIMAVDRGNAKVSNLYNVFNPSVLKAIEMAIQNAKKAGIPVGMCGEAAADPKLIPLLLEWGLDEFSVSPERIPETKKIICL